MQRNSIKQRLYRLCEKISNDYWLSYQEWLDELTEKQSAKYWLHCYYFGCKEKLLPSLPELERDTETDFDVTFWSGEGQDLFVEADTQEHKKQSRFCVFCDIKLFTKDMLAKGFEKEQQEEMERTKHNLLTTYEHKQLNQ